LFSQDLQVMYDKKMIYFSGREALIVHFLGGRSNLATLLSIPSESGEYLISFVLLILLLHSLHEHWGQCSS
jgi:hypothetical protein